MKTTRARLRDAVVEALRGQTMAGNEVYKSRDWPTAQDELPVIHVLALRDRKSGVQSGALMYNTSAQIDVLTAISRGGPETSLDLVNDLADEIAAAVISDQTIRPMIQGAPDVETEMTLSSAGETQIAKARVTFTFKYIERYQPGPGVPLQAITNGEPGGFGSFQVTLPESQT